ncbi:MAG TPA: hypothetical protein PLL98_11465, partial [Bacillota bacterium]|nr:hypothetical protein [Bacillota bacterium]
MDIRSKLPNGFPNIPVASDAEFDHYMSEMLSSDDNIAIVYKSKQSLESLYNLYTQQKYMGSKNTAHYLKYY